MTDADLKKYYADLLIMQYRDKEKARGMIELLADMVIMNQLPIAVQNAFNIDDAEGVQLDTIGKIVGVNRTGFYFDNTIVLDDEEFRLLIYFKIGQNNSGSSLYDIQNMIATYFPGQMYVFDYKTMRLSYIIDSDLGTQNLIKVVIAQGLLPCPMAVQLSATIYVPTIDKFFGFRTYKNPGTINTPFQTYTDYNTSWLWLNYSDAIFPQPISFNSMLTEDGDYILVQENGDELYI